MVSIGRCMAIVCIGLSACSDEGGEDELCERGAAMRCVPEHNGPREHRYCQVDETWSECTPEVLCDPLNQIGCQDGTACYLASLYLTVCAPVETLPCSPVTTWARGIEGPGCQPLCESDGPGNLNEDPEHCEDGELCMNVGLDGYEGVGECYTSPGGGG